VFNTNLDTHLTRVRAKRVTASLPFYPKVVAVMIKANTLELVVTGSVEILERYRVYLGNLFNRTVVSNKVGGDDKPKNNQQ